VDTGWTRVSWNALPPPERLEIWPQEVRGWGRAPYYFVNARNGHPLAIGGVEAALQRRSSPQLVFIQQTMR
jgi:hypothetical protein